MDANILSVEIAMFGREEKEEGVSSRFLDRISLADHNYLSFKEREV